MGTSLTGLTPATTYDALIKVGDNGPLSATAKYLSDGLGNDSILALSTTSVGVGTLSTSLFGITAFGRVLGVEAISGYAAVQVAGALGSGGEIDFGASTIRQGAIASLDGSALGFYTNGTNSGNVISERMRITSAGNVGIGTTTPNTPLTLVGEHVGGQSTFKIQPTTAYASGGLSSIGFNDSDGVRKGLILQEASGIKILTENASPIRFDVNNSERGRWTTDGLCFNGDTAAANALDDYEEGTWTPSFGGTTFSGTIAATYTKIGRLVTVQMNFVNQTLASSAGTASISGLPFTCNSATFGIVSFTFCDALLASVASGYVGVSGTAIQIRTNTGINDTSFVDGTSNRSMMLTATYFV